MCCSVSRPDDLVSALSTETVHGQVCPGWLRRHPPLCWGVGGGAGGRAESCPDVWREHIVDMGEGDLGRWGGICTRGFAWALPTWVRQPGCCAGCPCASLPCATWRAEVRAAGSRRSAPFLHPARPRNCPQWLTWCAVAGGVARGLGSGHVWSLESARVTVQKALVKSSELSDSDHYRPTSFSGGWG